MFLPFDLCGLWWEICYLNCLSPKVRFVFLWLLWRFLVFTFQKLNFDMSWHGFLCICPAWDLLSILKIYISCQFGSFQLLYLSSTFSVLLFSPFYSMDVTSFVVVSTGPWGCLCFYCCLHFLSFLSSLFSFCSSNWLISSFWFTHSFLYSAPYLFYFLFLVVYFSSKISIWFFLSSNFLFRPPVCWDFVFSVVFAYLCIYICSLKHFFPGCLKIYLLDYSNTWHLIVGIF